MTTRRWLEPLLLAVLAAVAFGLALAAMLGMTGCAATGVTSCPPCPPVPTPSFVDRPVQQAYPPVTVAEQPDCGEPAEAADSNGKLNWLLRCLALMTQWGEVQTHELESVNAARVTPTPAPGG